MLQSILLIPLGINKIKVTKLVYYYLHSTTNKRRMKKHLPHHHPNLSLNILLNSKHILKKIIATHLRINIHLIYIQTLSFITLVLMGKEVIYRRLNILRNRTLLDRMDNSICGSRRDRFHI